MKNEQICLPSFFLCGHLCRLAISVICLLGAADHAIAQGRTYTDTVNGISFKMVYVEGGTFDMGCTDGDCQADELPVHRVTLSGFNIAETEVTQILWSAVMDEFNPIEFKKNDGLPVKNVSWYEAVRFIQRLNELTGKRYRLPTEAEWEFAARGGNLSQGHPFSGSDRLQQVAWFEDNSEEGPSRVKSKKPNELGLYDMSGNVWEWCQDRYGPYAPGNVTDPTGPESGFYRVRRGGGYLTVPQYCRVYVRQLGDLYIYSAGVGLRLVCD